MCRESDLVRVASFIGLKSDTHIQLKSKQCQSIPPRCYDEATNTSHVNLIRLTLVVVEQLPHYTTLHSLRHSKRLKGTVQDLRLKQVMTQIQPI